MFCELLSVPPGAKVPMIISTKQSVKAPVEGLRFQVFLERKI